MDIISYFTKAVQENRVPHAHLFLSQSRPKGVLLLQNVLYHILCASKQKPCATCDACRGIQGKVPHPDIHMLAKEAGKRDISIEHVRTFIGKLHKTRQSAPYRVGIIYDADMLSTPASHALLKTLEEPKGETLLFLLAPHTHSFPKTICSRVAIIRVHNTRNNIETENETQVQRLHAMPFHERIEAITKIMELEKNEQFITNLTREVQQQIMEHAQGRNGFVSLPKLTTLATFLLKLPTLLQQNCNQKMLYSYLAILL